MEEDQEVIKHVCRICCKSFPCGRSLGGHMRSHDHDHDDHDDDGDESFVVVSASTTVKKEEGCSEGYYGLRENPKKTWRALNDSTSDDQEEAFDVVLDKLCKECGRGFQSWKALFGHMKCHSSSKNNGFELDEQESNTDASAAAVLPSRKRRSKRRLKTRYVNGKSSSSVVSFAANSVSEEDEHEQEEVAMSLMMLSRDVRSWSGLNSIAESSDNDDNDDNKSVELEAPLTRLVSSNLESKEKSLEIFDDGLKMKKTRVSVKDKMKIEVDSDSAFEVNVRSKPGTSSTSKAKYTSMKENFYDCENKVSSEAEIAAKKSRKRGKFECATCNRVFHSYQALGGHRAGHKRSKGCFALKIDQNSENESNAEVDKKINVSDEGRVLESEGVVEEVEEVPEIRNFLDLNLPADASIVDERNGHSEIYTPWWLDGSNFKQESMVGLLSN
ncbi:zinc finger protein ZAT1-like [Vicia villosa]|uniref:zinc finger protein ZAT1-like n=1 Tax=Vicia villosa TaxID=3911 RepID=UPI00273C0081|nr:zinc finger protein ZAT1-like [Vicia villosa]